MRLGLPLALYRNITGKVDRTASCHCLDAYLFRYAGASTSAATRKGTCIQPTTSGTPHRSRDHHGMRVAMRWRWAVHVGGRWAVGGGDGSGGGRGRGRGRCHADAAAAK